MTPFNPLRQFNLVMDDPALSPTQRLVLCAAIIHTSNGTGRVRCSQQILADAAHVTTRSVERALAVPAVRRYFIREPEGRRVNLTWRTTDILSSIPDTESGNTRQRVGPSTSIYESSTRTGASLADTPSGGAICGTMRGRGFWNDELDGTAS